MRLQRLRGIVRHEASTFSTPLGRLHLTILTLALLALALAPEDDESVLSGCLATVLAFECAVVSDWRSGGNAAALLRLRAESFTVGAARLVGRIVSLCAAACVVTFLLPLVVLVVSPAQRDVFYVFPVLVVAIMTARVMYPRVARWRLRHPPAPGSLGRCVAGAARLYEESCRVLVPANARPQQLEAHVRLGRLAALLLRASFALALAALAVLLAGALFAIPALIPNTVFEEDLAAVTAEGQVVFPTMAIVGVLLLDALQWLRGWETDHEAAATVHVVVVAAAVAVLGDRFDEIISWASSLASGLTGPSETAASVAVGTAFGLVGALFFDTAASLLSAVLFLTRPHRGLTQQRSASGDQDAAPAS